MSQGGSQGGKGGATPQAGTNPYTNAAQGMQGAFNVLGQMGNNIAGQQAQTYNPALGTAQGYSPVTAGAANYNAAMQQDPAAIRSQMGRYQNPYEDQVVQSTSNEVMRNLQQQQMQNADAAAAAGAFGGGRHGLVEATTNAEALRNIGDLTGQLRSQGFNTAAGLAGQDIANQMQVAGMNQAALNQQRQFGAGNRQQTNLTNQAAQNAAGQYNAGNRQQMQLANQGAQNEAGQFNALQRGQFGLDQTNQLQNLASTLGNLSQASFGMGSSLTNQQQQQGNMSQQLLQSILGQGQGQFDQLVQSPQQLLQLRLASLGMNPLNNATSTTQTTNPGWGSMFGNLLGAAGNMFSFNPITLPFGG